MLFKVVSDCYSEKRSQRKATLYWKGGRFLLQVDSPGNVLWPLPKRLLLSPVATDTRRDEERRWNMSMGYERRGYGGGANRFGPKPVEEGKEYDVDIKEISRRGEGIARVEGLVVFVPNTKPGDHVKVKITRVSNRFASGEVIQ